MIERLLVLKGNHAVYDELFHKGINVIRGDHSVGKTTILELIFYILGGEIKSNQWLYPADKCSEIYCQVLINGNPFTLNRIIDVGSIPSIRIREGRIDDLEVHDTAWKTYGPRRNESKSRLSFSQQMFELFGWDSHKSDDYANLTMHQILRFLYVDQETASTKILRAEDGSRSDNESIRTAIAEFLLGLDNLDTHKLRQDLLIAEREFGVVSSELKAMYKVLGEDSSLSSANLEERIISNTNDITSLRQIEQIDSSGTFLPSIENKRYMLCSANIEELNNELQALKLELQINEGEIADSQLFRSSLEFRKKSLLESKVAYDSIGSIHYTHCPCCIAEIENSNPDNCHLCNSKKQPSIRKNNYMEILTELDFQISSNSTVYKQYISRSQELKTEIVIAGTKLVNVQSELSQLSKTVDTNSYELLQTFERIGFLEAENLGLEAKARIINALDGHKLKKLCLQSKINELRELIDAASHSSSRRKNKVYDQISNKMAAILSTDNRVNGNPYEKVFASAASNNIEIDFAKDRTLIDGRVKFSGSSNYIKKNAFHLSALYESLNDSNYRLPRFLMIDAIENGGMKEFRSQQFQKTLFKMFEGRDDFQLIFCTSMVLSDLNNDHFGVGPYYAGNVLEI